MVLLALAVGFAGRVPPIWAAAPFWRRCACSGLYDLVQTRHSILRNYPVIGHIRWIAELIRPEIRQYLFEADEEAAPFSRSQRSLVYQRAKGEPGEQPFGTLLDVYRDGYEFIGHSTAGPAADPETFRITIGGDAVREALFGVGIQHLRHELRRARRQRDPRAQRRRPAGRLHHDTGEGSISALSPRGGRRHRLGGGQRLFRLPHRRRALRPRTIRRPGAEPIRSR